MWIKIEDWLTPMEYSRHIGKSMTWVTKLMQSGKLPYIRYSGGRLIHKSGKILPEYIKEDKTIDVNNPIIDGRIVSDTTFAVRLRSFIRAVDVCDAMSEEEKEYFLSRADALIEYQRQTSTDKEEVEYLKRMGII